MGTETSIPNIDPIAYKFLSVKLNNPLMGTETRIHTFYDCEHLKVKLNNPLMGTETPCGFLYRL